MRRVAMLLALLLTVGLLAWRLPALRLNPFDFLEYWVAGRLVLEGRNPYDADEVRARQQAAGREHAEVLMWNPPWTLPLVIPFALPDLYIAHLLWLTTQFLVLTGCAIALWRFHRGSAERLWAAWLIAFTFLPSLMALTAGQISPLLLLGAVGFLYAQRANQPILTGLTTLLLAIKPHLTLLFFVALVLDEVRRKRWLLLLSGVFAGLVAIGIAWLFHPGIVEDYFRTVTGQPPSQYRSPTLGTVLRLALGWDRFWLQFVPPAAGLIWLGWYWHRHRRDWCWDRHLSPVLFASLLTAAYGAWPFDLVLLLVPVFEVFRRAARGRLVWAIHLLLSGIGLIQLADRAEFFYFLWMSPALCLGLLLVSRPSSRPDFS